MSGCDRWYGTSFIDLLTVDELEFTAWFEENLTFGLREIFVLFLDG